LPSIWARLAAKFAMTALVAAYGTRIGEGMSELTEEVPMRPLLRSPPSRREDLTPPGRPSDHRPSDLQMETRDHSPKFLARARAAKGERKGD
jgi:hypothetical protein